MGANQNPTDTEYSEEEKKLRPEWLANEDKERSKGWSGPAKQEMWTTELPLHHKNQERLQNLHWLYYGQDSQFDNLLKLLDERLYEIIKEPGMNKAQLLSSFRRSHTKQKILKMVSVPTSSPQTRSTSTSRKTEAPPPTRARIPQSRYQDMYLTKKPLHISIATHLMGFLNPPYGKKNSQFDSVLKMLDTNVMEHISEPGHSDQKLLDDFKDDVLSKNYHHAGYHGGYHGAYEDTHGAESLSTMNQGKLTVRTKKSSSSHNFHTL
jgi:hypothetical protein